MSNFGILLVQSRHIVRRSIQHSFCGISNFPFSSTRDSEWIFLGCLFPSKHTFKSSNVVVLVVVESDDSVGFTF